METGTRRKYGNNVFIPDLGAIIQMEKLYKNIKTIHKKVTQVMVGDIGNITGKKHGDWHNLKNVTKNIIL